MANTFKLISTITIGSGGAANFEFTNIPQDYTDLQIVVSSRTNGATAGEPTYLAFNGDMTTSNYASKNLEYNGSSAYSFTNYPSWAGLSNGANSTSNTFANSTLYITNYSSTTKAKYYMVEDATADSSTTAYGDTVAGIWNNTAAISSIKITGHLSSSFVQNTTASLYGILKGSGGATVA